MEKLEHEKEEASDTCCYDTIQQVAAVSKQLNFICSFSSISNFRPGTSFFDGGGGLAGPCMASVHGCMAWCLAFWACLNCL